MRVLAMSETNNRRKRIRRPRGHIRWCTCKECERYNCLQLARHALDFMELHHDAEHPTMESVICKVIIDAYGEQLRLFESDS